MALILNIDTSTKSTSVALSEHGYLIELIEEHEVVSHASKLTPFIKAIFDKTTKNISDLDAVAINIGPGSYTGLRIGLSVAKGLCYTLEIPLIAFSGLEAMLFEAKRLYASENKLYVAAMNSRKNEIYAAFFNASTNTFIKPKPIVLDQDFLNNYKNDEIFMTGTGLEKIKLLNLDANIVFNENLIFSAKNMVQLSEKHFLSDTFADLAYVEPEYLKPFMTTTN
ncbi:MAG: tRNA (adenosine(37)-N6)-threonylcarbamoyltransferase complex dimerization subunit type 1 TsaB [Chitinophagales bacterium]